ncbi:PAS domain-containing protein [Alsobacter sp. KACC 23698]|uniref:histidine kinase n=1 Tax=Alsobacter sp. KACC 23698 TaxID=3149229 RepID=A0AAU7J903_9HYPH
MAGQGGSGAAPALSGVDYAALFDSAPNPYVLVDPAFVIVGMNEAYLRVTMRERAELLGRNMFEAFPPGPEDSGASSRLLRDSLERVLRQRTADHIALIKYDIPRPDGQFDERYWSATHTPLLGPNGDVAYILQNTVDVTELHKLRQATRQFSWLQRGGGDGRVEGEILQRAQAVQDANVSLEAERRHLRSLFEQAPGFMAVLRGPTHVFEIANAAYSQVVGHRDILGKPVAEALPEIAGQGFFELLDQVYASGEPFVGRGLKAFLQHEPGAPLELRYLDLVYQPIFDQTGAVVGIFVQGNDITEQKRAEEALRESEANLLSLANLIPQFVWMAAPSGWAYWYNQRWYDYTGTTQAEVEGDGWRSLHHPDHVERVSARLAEAFASGEPWEDTFPLRGKDGAYRWFLSRAVPVRDEDGAIVRWFGTNTDVTDQLAIEERLRESEERIRRLNETLEQRVIDRTIEMQEARDALQLINHNLEAMVAARVSDLKAANEEIQRFAYIVSHDLRAPLVNIMGFTSELEALRAQLQHFVVEIGATAPDAVPAAVREGVGQDLPEAIGFIRSSTDKMDRLIKAILRLSREGRRVLAPEPLDMRAVLEGVFKTLAHQADGVAFVLGDTPDILSDRLAVEQIFANLAENAVKYRHPEREGRIMFRGERVGDLVRYQVVDNGRGIDLRDFDRIFDLFRRSGVQDTPGEGIGLAHVRALVRRLGGTITVASEPGEGSTFTVELPATLHAAEDAA